MCDPVSGTIAATAIAGAFVQRSAQRRAQANVSESIQRQDQAQAKAQEAADAIGPAAKPIDLAKDAQAYQSLKRNKVAMQQGIMGTMKTNPMAQSNTSTIKATLGS